MADSSAGKLIAAFVLLIIGIVLVSQVAVIGNTVTAKSSVTSEAQALNTNQTDLNVSGMDNAIYQIAESPTGWKLEDCPITNFAIANSSGSVLVSGTDFRFTAANGTWVLLKTVLTKQTLDPANVSYQSYSYCGDDYINLGWGRTGVNLVPGFFALALLLISVGLFYSVAKENGIIN